jgi:cold shock CspA family protein
MKEVGQLVKWMQDRQYGFLKVGGDKPDCFVHGNEFQDEPRLNDWFEFERAPSTHKPDKPCAIRVRRLDKTEIETELAWTAPVQMGEDL